MSLIYCLRKKYSARFASLHSMKHSHLLECCSCTDVNTIKDVFRKNYITNIQCYHLCIHVSYVFQAQAWPVLLQGLDLIGIAQVCTFQVKTSVLLLSFVCIFSVILLYFS